MAPKGTCRGRSTRVGQVARAALKRNFHRAAGRILCRRLKYATGSLQLLVFNEEFLVSASHQLALTTSLPFVHTARRSYRLNGPVKCSDRGDVAGPQPATSREVH
ncbi:hypothetical protein V6N13_019360 [Hibiscus sabdariffa]